MSVLNQKTLNKTIVFDGVGLHSGKKVHLEIKPAKPNTGIVFKRIDITNNNLVIPGVFNVSSAAYCTTISNDSGVIVSTIEHLMGALFGMGIDNVMIEINSEEVPILDGSAKEFIKKIIFSGIEISESPIKIIKINKKIEYSEGERFISIEPSVLSLDIDFQLKYKNKIIGNQKNKVSVYDDDLNDIYNSRTFCLYEDIENIKKSGLAKGGSLENAIVVKDNKILNENGLRNDLEFVNHKILDCMGDLALSGYKIVGSIICSQGGHSLTNELLRKVFSDKSNFSLIELKGKNLPHSFINKSLLKSIA